MTPINVRICHDHNLVIAQLLNVKIPLNNLTSRIAIRATPNPRANRRDHRLHFLVLQHLLQPGLLRVDQLSTQRQDRLIVPISSHLRGSTRRVTFDNKQLGLRRIPLRTVRQLARQSTAAHRILPDRRPRPLSRLTRFRRDDHLRDHLLRRHRILIKETHQPLINHRAHHPLHLAIHQFHLRLRVEPRVRQLHTQHTNQTLTTVIPFDLRNLVPVVLKVIRIPLDISIHRPCQRRFQSAVMRSPIRIRNRIRKAQ